MDFSDKIFADNLIPVFSEKGRKDYIIFDCGV
ncbi:unknown [Bacteroides sp. CAG:20]|nr:unknown [Bacteroides sp. CAG:20]